MAEEPVEGVHGPYDDPLEPVGEPLGSGRVSLTGDEHATRVIFAGDVDLSMLSALTSVTREALARGVTIRLDVSQVTFIDSTAIGSIVSLAVAERDSGRRLAVIGADRRTRDTFELGGITPFVDLVAPD
jgi:anti-anti-sigma factor